ncbi:MAG: Si-specific NAD(P)(+) transhydrogenase [Candidatus Eisenbacteria bacterium]
MTLAPEAARAIGHFDLAVIGSGPAGQKAAIAAAKLGKRVAVIDRRSGVGGASLHTGTIPSKTLREAILYLSGMRHRSFYGGDYVLQKAISAEDLALRVRLVQRRELAVVVDQFRRNGVTLVEGFARFLGPHELEVTHEDGVGTITADHVLIACGTRPAHSDRVVVDDVHVFDSDMRGARAIAHDVIVVGAGVIGLEYGSMFAALGVQVTIIDQQPKLLEFADREIIRSLRVHLESLGVVFRLEETVRGVSIDASGHVVCELESGTTLNAETLFYCIGRQANTDQLNLSAVGLSADTRGRLAVNECYQTGVPHIYAAGDVVGFPALASSSMEQGRIAACHMFGAPYHAFPLLLPIGIYTIPEIAMVGQTEDQLEAAGTPYAVGIARYEDVAKAQLLGAVDGMLKLVFNPQSLRVLGVHILGESASELAHLGQAVIAFGGTLEYFRDTVFNYPTLSEAYKVAALNGLNRLRV